uniref:Uncharacterized protein n=1 Tax=uncultured marine virus TaxID=186617 RepID=A0A0F7LAR3_9VIRU|nr:hypothetical protein [uncultured marine virus]
MANRKRTGISSGSTPRQSIRSTARSSSTPSLTTGFSATVPASCSARRTGGSIRKPPAPRPPRREPASPPNAGRSRKSSTRSVECSTRWNLTFATLT